jgi:glycolate oxidase iron-sulfur subunit
MKGSIRRPLCEGSVHLKEGLTSPLFAPALKVGQAVRGLLPKALASKVPARPHAPPRAWPTRTHERRVLMLAGCVQPALMPNINNATARVLDAAGIQTVLAPGAGCCGAIRAHLGDHEGGLTDMRRNIDAWWPSVAAGEVHAIVMNASGSGVTVKEYGHALRHDPAYAQKAQRIGDLTKNLSELLPSMLPALRRQLDAPKAGMPRLAFHPPCTLQHGQQLRGGIEAALRELGFEHVLGSAARARLPVVRSRTEPPRTTAGGRHCVGQHRLHPAAAKRHPVPVRHWVELLDEALSHTA